MGINVSISASRINTGECDFTVRTTGVFLYFQIISFAAQVLVGFQQPLFMTKIKYYFVILLVGFVGFQLLEQEVRSTFYVVEVYCLKPSSFTL